MRKTFLSIAITLMFAAASFAQSDKPMLFRQPTMNKTDIVFVFAGDLWKVSAQRRSGRTTYERDRKRIQPDLFAGRQLDRVHGRI